MKSTEILPLSVLKQRATEGRLEAAVHGQVETLTKKETRDGKPFWELVLADAEAKITLRAWSDSPAFAACEEMSVGTFLEVTGAFAHNGGFGLDAKQWNCRELTAEERDTLLAGSPELREKQGADFAFIEQTVGAIADPRLRELAVLFLTEYGPRFRRAAAARGNHHARRGGLVEHVAQMMRGALAVAGAYPFLNRDLLVAGVLFHDSGKLWENSLPADGFVMPFDERGEMLGHITIGIELVNALWRKVLATEVAAGWAALLPASEDVRLHLLHLLAAHHGELQFGSPVVPKTPEAWALHYVDNLDAKMEMMTQAYATSRQLGPRIQERVWPLPGNLVAPLEKFTPAEES
ncbi:nucleic acid binding OB-fold tRNA/helicase-type [Chthoniobacter flavus Ellin428]|uniref:Nucleic acid binding OB-fold tRNA/helicase-type n=1 Tax=Chthoniobacter flavus Ellin428 TaxID=497964 RepID=B4D8R3_9BACT|nr:HD domain-containing protein [Chthoniobacter flavus]EDY17121.1 nucleic acid binding OB-fold tRNA/helicase-type [Chthoniobacter flavus Ellin428]TCO90219.1 3'-5' exoribonuclease [Chthoniobacter flavus]